jgi:hypothetical protein
MVSVLVLKNKMMRAAIRLFDHREIKERFLMLINDKKFSSQLRLK